MKMRRWVLLPSITALAALWGGCAATSYVARDHEPPALPPLVTPSPLLLVLAGDAIDVPDWEHARNDVPRRIEQPPDAERIWVEVRHREHLRTINGRPSEYTTTRSHSIRRRVH
jgi:hypothetical protein